jgi:hypothetical protein
MAIFQNIRATWLLSSFFWTGYNLDSADVVVLVDASRMHLN